MHFQGKKLRNELKFYISIQDYLTLHSKVSSILELDSHSVTSDGYGIRSLYFDGMHAHSLYDKNDGIFNREKYRIRIYNESDVVIRLERKSKYGSYIHKESAPLSRAEYDCILKGDYEVLENTVEPLLRNFYHALAFRNFRASAITDYTREAYVHQAGNVRITFDKRLAAGINGMDMFHPDLMLQEVIGPGQTIMEVKFDEFLPDHIRRVLQPEKFVRSAISKYVICKEANIFQYKQ